MDKKDILDQNKRQNRHSLDEREQRIYNASFGIGAVVVGVLCLAFSIFKAVHHQMFYEFAAIITAYLCTTFFYQYKNLRNKFYLAAGILSGVAAVLTTVLFFMGYMQ